MANLTNPDSILNYTQSQWKKPNFSISDVGVFSGRGPLGSHLAIFLVQALIIIGLSRFLHFGLAKLRQPRVIAEVIGGICLGPSVLGMIPGFTETIFPRPSLPFLSLVANVGLVFYLFLVGLELDPLAFFRDLRRSLVISAAGMVVPFCLGAAVSFGMYEKLMSEPKVPFTSFLLFTGCAMSITAFPVLARILAEFKLLTTPVGLMTITAAAADDATAWALLALIVSILHAGSMLTALYVFLVVIGYALIILIPFRILFQKVYDRFCGKKSHMLTPFLVSSIFLLIFLSAWITDLIGIHAIFGAFLMGLAIPRSDGLPIRLTEKIEDLVNIAFLPLFFASSGLKTKVGLLNDGWTWLWLFLIITVACAGKIFGCAFAAKAVGIPWRESWSVGILMNTKGLVELIVLNIGLEAHVINDRIFVVMVIMALITTFITSPVISFVYPPRFHKRIDVPAERLANDTGPLGQVRLLLLLESIDSLGQFAKLLRLFKGPNSGKADVPENETVTLKTLRIVRSSERSSSIIAASQATAAAEADPALKAANYLGEFLNVPASSTLATSTVSDVSDIINDFVAREDINLMLVPYTQLDGMTSAQMGEIISRSTVTTAILVGRLVVKVRRVEFILNTGILVPFVGGPDDRRAVTLALRLHQSAGIPLRIFHLRPIKMENTGKGAKSVTFDQKLEEDEKFMKDLRIKYERNDTVSFSSIDAGDPASVVAEECEQNDYELVLLGRSAKAPNGSTPDVVAMERKSSASMLAKISYIREFSRDSGKSALGGDSILGHMARKLMDSQANCSLLIVYEPPELKSV